MASEPIIDGEEIAFIIAKACLGMSPPEGTHFSEAMRQLAEMDADATEGFRRAATAVMHYLANLPNAPIAVVPHNYPEGLM